MITCTKCKIEKSEDEFYPDKKKKNGLQSWCKSCCYNLNKEWVKNNSERRNEVYRKWCKNNLEKIEKYKPKKREIDKINKRRYRKEHPELWIENRKKYWKNAYQIVYKALKTGKLKKKPCEACGKKKAHAHHEDYDKPFEIKWLCPLHHKQYHIGRVAFSL